jgi:hypothetical protein
MIIANIRNPTDLENKRRLQQQLIDLEVANEGELERRVKDFKDPNKPLPVAPQFKTNAELRKDKLEQERQAIKNLGDLGLDYTRSGELTAWLGSSEIDKVVDFNANYKGIKKELTETTNPKLLTSEYLKNYLERYFQDLDVSYGKKFAQQTQTETQETLSVDDLVANIPTDQMLNELKDTVIYIRKRFFEDSLDNELMRRIDELSTKLDPYYVGRYTIREEEEPLNLPDEATRKQMEKELRNLLKERADNVDISNEAFLVSSLIDLYLAILPSNEFFQTLKLTLTILERTDLVRRYGRLFQKIKALDSKATDELIDEGRSAFNSQTAKMFIMKTKRALSFLGDNKNVDVIQTLNRNYENELNKSGKITEFTKIKKLNDIQAKEAQEARENIKNFYQHPFGNKEEFYNDDFALPKTIERKRTDKKGIDMDELAVYFLTGEKAREIDAYEDPNEKAVMAEIEAQKQLWEDEKARRLAEEIERRRIEEAERVATIREGLTGVFTELGEKEAKRIEKETRNQLLAEAIRYYDDFMGELNEILTRRGVVSLANTLIQFLPRIGLSLPDRKTNLSKNDAEIIVNSMMTKLREWIGENRIQPIARGELPLDYDITGERGRNLLIPAIYNTKTPPTVYEKGKTALTKGLGLKTAIKKHFRDDEKELMEIAKSFNRHKKKERKIDDYADETHSISSSDEEKEEKSKKEQGGSLGFKHKRIKIGKGIDAPQKQSNYRAFGKYVIHIPHLIDKNIANFKYKSLGSIPSIRPVSVSEDYKDFLIETLDNGRPNEKLLRKLPVEEQKHFERVIVGAGLNDTFRIRKSGDEEERREHDRFNVLRGEVLAGNNNERVLKELRGLVIKFINEGKIRRQEGLNMLMEISAI